MLSQIHTVGAPAPCRHGINTSENLFSGFLMPACIGKAKLGNRMKLPIRACQAVALCVGWLIRVIRGRFLDPVNPVDPVQNSKKGYMGSHSLCLFVATR